MQWLIPLGVGASATWLLWPKRRVGTWHWRLPSPIGTLFATVTSGWGDNRGSGRIHEGLDFAVPIGTPIYAVADGTVITAHSAADDGISGKYVLLSHNGTFSSLYCHLDSLSVARGDVVRAGQEIGKSGRTGIHYSGPHLHFGMFIAKGLLAAYTKAFGKPSTGWGRTTWRDEVAVPSEPLIAANYSARVIQRAAAHNILLAQ